MPCAGRLARRETQPEGREGIRLHQLALPGRGAPIGQRREVELQIGRTVIIPQPGEAAALVEAHRQGPPPGQGIFQRRAHLAMKRAQHLVQAGLARREHEVHTQMIAKVAAHLGCVPHHADFHFLQQRTGADARQLQQLRRVDRPAAEDHFRAGMCPLRAAPPAVLHAGGAAAIKQYARRQCAMPDAQAVTAAQRPEIGLRGRGAAAVPRGDLVEARAGHLAAVVIGVGRDARLLRRLHIGAAERVHRIAHVAHADRPALPACGMGAPCQSSIRRKTGSTSAHCQPGPHPSKSLG